MAIITTAELQNKIKAKPQIKTTAELIKPVQKAEPLVESKKPIFGAEQIIPESPLSMPQRAALSYAETPEQGQSYLEKTFGKGNVIPLKKAGKFAIKRDGKIYASDPEGFSIKELPKDVADVIADIPDYALPLLVDLASSNPYTAVLGAGASFAASKLLKQATGERLGVLPKKEGKELTKELGQEAIKGATTAAGLGVASTLAKNAWRIATTLPETVTQMPNSMLKRTATEGIDNMAAKVGDPDVFLSNVSKRVDKGIKSLQTQYKTMYGQIDNAYNASAVKPTIDITPVKKAITDTLQSAGVFDAKGKLILKGIANPNERTAIKNLVEYLKSTKSTLGLPEIKNLQSALFDYSKNISRVPQLKTTIIDMNKTYLTPQKVAAADKLGLGAVQQSADSLFSTVQNYKNILKPVLQPGKTVAFAKEGVEYTPVKQLEAFLQKGSAENEIVKDIDSVLPTQFKFVDDFERGATMKDWNERGKIIDRMRKLLFGEIPMRTLETPLRMGAAVSKKLSPIIQKGVKALEIGKGGKSAAQGLLLRPTSRLMPERQK